MVPIGSGVGAVTLGMAIGRWGHPRALAAVCLFFGLCAMIAMVMPFLMPQWLDALLAFLIGIGASASLVGIIHARVFSSDANVGAAIGVVTTAGYMFGTALQSGAGLLLEELRAQGLSDVEYNDSLAPLVQCFALALLMLTFMRPWPQTDGKREA